MVCCLIPSTVFARYSDYSTSGKVYNIRNIGSRKYLNVNLATDANGTNVNQWDGDGSIEQKFKVEAITSNVYYLRAMCSSNGNDKVVDAYSTSGSPYSGANCDIWTPNVNDQLCQRLTFTRVDNNYYYIAFECDSTIVLTANGNSNGSINNSTTSPGNVYWSQKGSSSYQLWEFIEVDGSSSSNPYADMGWSYPVPGHNDLSLGFGTVHNGVPHKGIDISDSSINGTPVYSAQSGTVLEAFFSTTRTYGYGYGLAITSNNIDPDTGNKLVYTYGHFGSPPLFDNNDYVGKNVVVGYVGSSGDSSGPHLHMQICKAGKFWTDNLNDFVNPVLFYPNIGFTRSITNNAEIDLNSNATSSDKDIRDYIFDMSFINYVGENEFLNWVNQNNEALVNEELTVMKFLEDFNIDVQTFNQIASENGLENTYDCESLRKVCQD